MSYLFINTDCLFQIDLLKKGFRNDVFIFSQDPLKLFIRNCSLPQEESEKKRMTGISYQGVGEIGHSVFGKIYS